MVLIVALLAADLVFTNGRIHTVNPAQPSATSLAVTAGRIAAVGDDLKAHITPETRVIDLKGAAVIPGFIDAHGHMRNLGESLQILNLRGAASAEAIGEMVAKAAKDRKPGEWIRGRGWDQTEWEGSKEFPTAAVLDKAAPRNPVYLTRVDGHAGWANTRALDLADVNAATKDPDGGRILKDPAGKPSGVLIDNAMGLVTRKIPPPTAAQVKHALSLAARECARLGLTGVHDAGVGEADLAGFRELIAEGGLPVRIYAMLGNSPELLDRYLRKGPETGDLLTVRSIKLAADGALGSRGAALIEPYSDEPTNRGLVIVNREAIESIARRAVAAGFQVNTHAIGDRANRDALDAYQAAFGGRKDLRYRIEHAQIVAPSDLPRFAALGVIASMQATHATSDMRWAHLRVGEERLRGAYAWKTFLKLGVPVANGSDFPVESANPLWGFYATVTRQDHSGYPAGGWRPQELLTRAEALKSWTLDAAYAAFEEKQKGSLEPGKLADFVVLSRDIMTIPPKEILETKVTMTVLGGKVVYPE